LAKMIKTYKTTIQVEKTTRDKLRTVGKKGESYDTIILQLLTLKNRFEQG